MKHILSRESVDVLAQFAWSKLLLAFDFDGTLAPIVANRDEARMRPRTHALLDAVCKLYPCAVISGRSRDDVAQRLGGVPAKYLVGNHGMEPGECIEMFEGQVKDMRLELEKIFENVPGIDVEDKRYSLAVHYRKARRIQEARRAIYEAIERLPWPVRTVAGKRVVNVLPERAPHKGDALLALRAQEGADTALYVGDDITDEDVFELDQPGRLLSIRVGQSRRSAAAFFLRNQREIDDLLERLVALKSDEQGG